MRSHILIALLSAATSVLAKPLDVRGPREERITPLTAPCLGDNNDYDERCLRAMPDENLQCLVGMNIQPDGPDVPMHEDSDYDPRVITDSAKAMAASPGDKEKEGFFYRQFGKAVRAVWKQLKRPAKAYFEHFHDKTLPELREFKNLVKDMFNADGFSGLRETLSDHYPGVKGKLRLVKNIVKWAFVIAVGVATVALTLKIISILITVTSPIWIVGGCIAIGSYAVHKSISSS